MGGLGRSIDADISMVLTNPGQHLECDLETNMGDNVSEFSKTIPKIKSFVDLLRQRDKSCQPSQLFIPCSRDLTPVATVRHACSRPDMFLCICGWSRHDVHTSLS